MSKTNRWTLVMALLILALAAFLLGGGDLLAQPQAKEIKADYDYVGVMQTMARIDQRTGRIEVLSRRGDARASLLSPGMEGWEWREIRLRKPRSRREQREAGSEQIPPGDG